MAPDSVPAMLALALILDLLLGDPRFLPHPVRAIGAVASHGERVSRRILPKHPRAAGLLTLAASLAVTGGTTALILHLAARAGAIWHGAAGGIIIYYSIALRDLIGHGLAVKRPLARGDLESARKKVAMLISRDPAQMDEAAVVRATVESLSENLVDALAAPLFWASLAGPVGAALYRTINTCDAMFGYKNKKYREFGLFPARTDDLVNLVPARLAGLLIPLAAAICGLDPRRSLAILFRDRKKHHSPNGGHPEAATAGALGIRLGGPGNYFGKIIDKPILGDDLRPPEARDIGHACRLVFWAGLLFAAIMISLRGLILT